MSNKLKKQPVSHLKEIILSGGGTNLLAIVGSLHVLYDKHKLDRVVRWIGSSAGALLCLTAVLGYSPASIFRLMMHIDYEKLNDANCDSMLSFYDTMGVLEGKHFIRIVELLLLKKGFHKHITFCELSARTNKELVVVGYNLTCGCTEAFDAQRTPHMGVLLACRISISVPFLFRPVKYNGNMYIDGCTIEHVPVRFSRYPQQAMIIQCVKHLPDLPETRSAPLPTDIPSFFSLFHRRISHQLHKKCMKRMIKLKTRDILSICISHTENISFVVDFHLTKDGKQKLFLLGTEATQKYLMKEK